MTRLVGTARARELMFTAARVDAATCERIGLVNRVVPDAELPASALQLAHQLAAGPGLALQAMKHNLDRAFHESFDEALDHEAEELVPLTRTEDHREAVRAFVEKRAPVFQGR